MWTHRLILNTKQLHVALASICTHNTWNLSELLIHLMGIQYPMCMWRCVTARGRWISMHKQTHKIKIFIEVISQTKILSIYDVRIKSINNFQHGKSFDYYVWTVLSLKSYHDFSPILFFILLFMLIWSSMLDWIQSLAWAFGYDTIWFNWLFYP